MSARIQNMLAAALGLGGFGALMLTLPTGIRTLRQGHPQMWPAYLCALAVCIGLMWRMILVIREEW
jgi:hypothetical protein